MNKETKFRYYRYIITHIGMAATYDALAEECAELSKACMKCSRIIRGENPTPVTCKEAHEKMLEEVVDVLNAIDAVFAGLLLSRDNWQKVLKIKNEKLQRWKERVEK